MLELTAVRRVNGLPRDVDAALFACGYERRASYIAMATNGLKCRRLVWAFTEHSEAESRRHNNDVFSALAAEVRELSGDDDVEAERAATEMISALPEAAARVLIDVSSMTRAWHGAIVRALAEASRSTCLRVTFAYMPGTYLSPSSSPAANKIVGPVHGFSRLAFPDSPTALLLGLGYERGRAMGILTEVDPTWTECFIAHPGADPRFRDDVVRANQDVARVLPNARWRTYPLNDPTLAFYLVDAACNFYSRQAQVIFTNNGPKLFGLVGLLAATRYPDVSVWRISSGLSGEIIERMPMEVPYLLDTEWAPAAIAANLGDLQSTAPVGARVI